MRRKIFTLLLLATISSGTVVIMADTAAGGDAAAARGPHASVAAPLGGPAGKRQQPPADEPGVINGEKNPELIPDVVAYSLLFRFVSGAQDDEAKKRVRHYVRQMGLGDQSCYACSGQDKARRGNERDLEAFLAAADEFRERVAPLDRRAIEIRRAHWPNFGPAVKAELSRLQRQKEALITELVASLPGRLSAVGLENVHRHVNERMKRRIKMPVRQGWANDTPAGPAGGLVADE